MPCKSPMTLATGVISRAYPGTEPLTLFSVIKPTAISIIDPYRDVHPNILDFITNIETRAMTPGNPKITISRWRVSYNHRVSIDMIDGNHLEIYGLIENWLDRPVGSDKIEPSSRHHWILLVHYDT